MHTNDARRRPPLFKRLKNGLKEGVDFAKGNANLRTTEVSDGSSDSDTDSETE